MRLDIHRVTNGKAMIIDYKDKMTLRNLMKRRRQKVIEFIRMFNKVYNTRGIISVLLSTKRKQGMDFNYDSQKSLRNTSKFKYEE